jgi:hypothetical protein
MIGANPNADTDDALDALTILSRGGAVNLRSARIIYEAMGYVCARVFDRLAVTSGAHTWEVLHDLTVCPITGTVPPAAQTIWADYCERWRDGYAYHRQCIAIAYRDAMDDAQRGATPEEATQGDNAVAVAGGLSNVVSQVEGQCDPLPASETTDAPNTDEQSGDTNDIDENDAN